MEFYDAVNARRTAREFLQKDVPFDAVKRILEAGNKAPTWDHNRSWQYIVLQTDEKRTAPLPRRKRSRKNSTPRDT